ncbi:ABC transporter permease [Mesorhizobium sp. M0808]|uniref:ABC transporter permease n=1 Tax=Mesorhizobium sp. M0808 TaxID=2957002 RepID=UPI003338D67F
MSQPDTREKKLLLRAGRRLGWALWSASRGQSPAILVGATLVVLAIFSVILRDTAFLTMANLLAIVRISTTTTVMTVATVYVLCAAEIDLSIASIVPVSALIAAVLLSLHVHFLLAVAVAISFGALVGLVNGLATVFFGIPSFVVTLGSMGVMQGLAQIVTHTNTISISDDRFLFWFGSGSVGSVPILAFWSFGVLVVGSVILSYTGLGRRVLATGANAGAARYSGIRTERIKVGVMVASGAAGALAGVLYDGQYAAGDFTLGSADLLPVIAAAVIGGCSLSGGRGSVVGAVTASLLIGMLSNVLLLAGFGAPEQLMVQGIIIVAAVIAGSRRGRGTLWRWLAALENNRDPD